MLLTEFFDDHGPLSAVIGTGFHKRDEQVRMAEVAMRTLERGGAAALADAKTGTGKSLGYLVPIALAGKRAIVSTATKALQHQQLVKDLPILCAAMEQAGLEAPTYALLKGRSNYLCQARHDAYLKQGIGLTDGGVHASLMAWRNTTTTGDLETLPIPKPSFWGDIASDGDDCHRKSCEYASECFYFTAKERVQGVDILIVNHHLLWANIASGGAVFSMADRALVLDEAHNLERSMMDAFGVQVTRHRVRYNLRAVTRRAVDPDDYVNAARDHCDAFFEDLEHYPHLHSYSYAPPALEPLLTDLGSLSTLVAHNPREEVNKLRGMLEKLIADLTHFYDSALDSHAYAIQAGNPPTLKSWLVSPGEVFREKILERDEPTILASATLAVGRSFDYPRKRLGFDKFVGNVREFMGNEIFDYARNALCYVADDLP
jgi:ATP-dependent DNA helicase DinG